MRREELCRLVSLKPEAFRTLERRGRLPFASEDFRPEGEAGWAEYTPNEALMLLVARSLGDATPDAAAIAERVNAAWQWVWARASEIGQADAPDLYLALVTWRSGRDDGVGIEFDTLPEIAANVMATTLGELAPLGDSHAAYAKRLYRHRQFYKAGGGALEVTAVALVNVSQTFRDLVVRAQAESIELDADFLEFFGAAKSE